MPRPSKRLKEVLPILELPTPQTLDQSIRITIQGANVRIYSKIPITQDQIQFLKEELKTAYPYLNELYAKEPVPVCYAFHLTYQTIPVLKS